MQKVSNSVKVRREKWTTERTTRLQQNGWPFRKTKQVVCQTWSRVVRENKCSNQQLWTALPPACWHCQFNASFFVLLFSLPHRSIEQSSCSVSAIFRSFRSVIERHTEVSFFDVTSRLQALWEFYPQVEIFFGKNTNCFVQIFRKYLPPQTIQCEWDKLRPHECQEMVVK